MVEPSDLYWNGPLHGDVRPAIAGPSVLVDAHEHWRADYWVDWTGELMGLQVQVKTAVRRTRDWDRAHRRQQRRSRALETQEVAPMSRSTLSDICLDATQPAPDPSRCHRPLMPPWSPLRQQPKLMSHPCLRP